MLECINIQYKGLGFEATKALGFCISLLTYLWFPYTCIVNASTAIIMSDQITCDQVATDVHACKYAQCCSRLYNAPFIFIFIACSGIFIACSGFLFILAPHPLETHYINLMTKQQI